MMWKDSYLLGVEQIDNQHKELFRMTEELVRAVSENAPMEEYRKILGFLKDYVIYHFRDEEAYQASIGYAGMEAHKKEHRQFTRTVLDYEKRLEENGYDRGTMKDLAGSVTAWLIYHVVDTDQKIVAGEVSAPGERRFERYVDLLCDSTLGVMEAMAGLPRDGARQRPEHGPALRGDIFIQLELTGDWHGYALFGFSRELALGLIRAMTMMELDELDELVQSALCELTNIACGNAATTLAGQGLHCDIRPPVVLGSAGLGGGAAVCVETAQGALDVAVCEQRPA